MTNKIAKFARAVNAKTRNAILGGQGNVVALNRNVTSTRNVAHAAINDYINKVIKQNVNKVKTAGNAKVAAQGAANIAAAEKVKTFLAQMKITNNAAGVAKLQTVISKISTGRYGSRIFGNSRVSANMNAGLKNTLQKMVAKFAEAQVGAVQAQNLSQIRANYIAKGYLNTARTPGAAIAQIISFRNAENKNRNLSTLASAGNKYNNLFRGANAQVKSRNAAKQASANAAANKVFRIEEKPVIIRKQNNGKWKIMNENVAARYNLNNPNNPTNVIKKGGQGNE